MKLITSKRRLAFIILCWLLLILTTLTYINSGTGEPDIISLDDGVANASIPEMLFPEDVAEDKLSVAVQYEEIFGQLLHGEGFDDALKRENINGDIRAEIIKNFAKVLDFRKLQPGDSYKIILNEEEELVSCLYESSPFDIYSLHEDDSGLKAEKLQIPLELRVVNLTGTIETSLYEALAKTVKQAKLITAYAEIFASKIDFNTETQVGDRFSLLVEEYYKDDIFVGYGRILAAAYDQNQTSLVGYYYDSGAHSQGYFDPNGVQIGTDFLKSPIPFGRVTSRFTFQRKHPILGVVRPHLGIDFAAPSGTPVMAVADGRVVLAGRKGGFGKQVIIKHPGGYQTHYGHLSGYGKGISQGAQVKQKQIIGYVGSTGLSTGPHLDYRIDLAGTFKNPFSIKFEPKSILNGEALADFQERTRLLVAFLQTPADTSVLPVRQVTLGKDKRLFVL